MTKRKKPFAEELLSMERSGKTCPEIAKVVGVHEDTARRWMRGLRGNKVLPRPKKAAIIKLLESGESKASTIALKTGASEKYVRNVRHELFETKPAPIRSAEEVIDAFFTRGDRSDFDKVSFPVYLARGGKMAKRVVRTLDCKPTEGVVESQKMIDEFEFRRTLVKRTGYKDALDCLISVAFGLKSSGLQKTGQLQEAGAALEIAKCKARDCEFCRAEYTRHEGWLNVYLWDAGAESCKDRALECYGEAIAMYEGFENYKGHNPHENGLCGSLYARSLLYYYLGDHDPGLEDAHGAMNVLDPDVSPGLVVTVIHTTALHLAKVGRAAEARKDVAYLLSIMEPGPTVPYAKVLWLHGLLEDDVGGLRKSRQIFVRRRLPGEASVVTADILLMERSCDGLAELRHYFQLNGLYGAFDPILGAVNWAGSTRV